MTPDQSREARRLLGWSQIRLAVEADLVPRVIMEFEFGLEVDPSEIKAIRAALETAGVQFSDPKGKDPGVGLRKDKS